MTVGVVYGWAVMTFAGLLLAAFIVHHLEAR